MTINPSQAAQPADKTAGASAQEKPVRAPLTGKPMDQVKADQSPRKAPSAFRTISEVSKELDVQQHVLRFWETKFSQIRPLKRGGGRRYYRPEDVQLLRTIHRLLYTEGYTIKGVQKLLREKGKGELVQKPSAPQSANTPPRSQQAADNSLTKAQRDILQTMLGELKELRKMVGDGF